MQYRQIGTTEIEASAVGLGTWVMGGWMWGGCDDAVAERAIQTALDAGITLIDTAPIYGFGRSEETVGRAIHGRRDSVVVASKCGLYWDYSPLPPNCGEWHCFANDEGRTQTLEKYAVYRWLRSDVIRRGVEDSLRRMKTDYIDVMQIHHASDRTTPISEAMGTLEDLRREGKIRAIGISNASRSQFDEFCACGSLDVDQERFSMLDRRIESSGLLEGCREKSVSLFAYSPLENGLLTGKLDPSRVYRQGDLRRGSPKFSKESVKKVNEALDKIKEIARHYDLEIGQFAASWVLSRYDKAFVLCGARTPEHALLHAGAGDAIISQEDLEAADDVLRDFKLIEPR